MGDDERPPEAAVIDLEEARVKLAGAPLRKVRSGHCGHYRSNIDTDKRTLTCRKCKAPLDPFDFLAGLANDHERYSISLQAVKDDLKRATAKLAETKRLERNARGRLKRLQAKLPGVDE
jgi:hypothetical protein